MNELRLVKLKMKKIYKAILSFLGLLILLTSSVGVLYLFYDKVIDNNGDIEVNGALSINYVDGKYYKIEKDETITFSVSNSSEEVKYYNIIFNRVRGDGTYRLYYKDALIMEGSLRTIDEIATDYISIDSLETKTYTLEITNTGDTPLKGLLNIRLQSGKINTFADTILKNSPASENALTKVGVEAAIEDEGLIKSNDDIGVSYYFRGSVKNNYFSLNDMLWRIVRINGDGTVRLILNETANSEINYYATSDYKENYNDSLIKTYLDSWLDENFRNYTNLIANTRYCNDVSHNDNYDYASYIRIMTNNIPTFNCLSETVSDSIGLLTVDELMMAGASPTNANKNFYLYDEGITDSWFTMSGATGNDESLNLFMFDQYGRVRTDIKGNAYHSVRPVINLIKNIEVTGSGTIDDPYKIVE